jgi:hypothetical protein
MLSTQRCTIVMAAAVACLCTGALRASANLLVNGGFETPVLPPGGAVAFATGQTIPTSGGDWTVIGDPGTSVYLLQDTYFENFNNVGQFNAQEGLNSVDLSGPFNQGPTAGVQQTVAVIPGQEYMLTFWVGLVTPASGPGGVYGGPVTVDVSIDGGPRQSFMNFDSTNNRINWKKFNLVFTATASSTTIAFFNNTAPGTFFTGLDNVDLVSFVASGVGDTPVPKALYLAAPKPNPVRNGAVLQYSLAEPGEVRLTLYAVNGRRIRVLTDGWRSGGIHSEIFEPFDDSRRSLVSGVYFVRLEAAGRVLTQKLLLIR